MDIITLLAVYDTSPLPLLLFFTAYVKGRSIGLGSGGLDRVILGVLL